MIRSLLFFVVILLVYHALKTVVRSAFRAFHEDDRRSRLPGEDMVLDPQCKTYVPKGRAVARRVRGNVSYFCSETCAAEYEAARKD